MSVPKAMMWSFGISSLCGLAFLNAFLFSITDVDAALNDSSGFSFLWVLKQTLPNTPAAVSFIVAIMVVVSFGSNISFNASTSRQTYAFARDGGLPFARWISRVGFRVT